MISASARAATAVVALVLAACASQADPPVTEPPEPGGEPTVSVRPTGAAPGQGVQLDASSFPPATEVVVGFGPPQSEFEEVTRATTDDAGTLSLTVPVPAWVDSGREYVWVVDEPIRGGRRAVSDGFVVTAQEGGGGGARVTIEGEVTDEGVECPSIRTADGTLYTLTGAPDWLSPGQRVRVTGVPAEVSFCQQGRTLDAERVERIRG